MKGKNLITILITFLLTSALWLLLIQNDKLGFLNKEVIPTESENVDELQNTVKSADEIESIDVARPTTDESTKDSKFTKKSVNNNFSDYPQAIVGKWKPVEVSSCTLNISEYGKLQIIEHGYGRNYLYCIKKDKLLYGKDEYLRDHDEPHRIEISSFGNATYLVIYDDAELAGKYIKM